MTMNDRQKFALESLTGVISNIYDQLDTGEIPSMSLPLRSKKLLRPPLLPRPLMPLPWLCSSL